MSNVRSLNKRGRIQGGPPLTKQELDRREQARALLEAVDPATGLPVAIPLLDQSDLVQKLWAEMTEEEVAAWHAVERVYTPTDLASPAQRAAYSQWRRRYPVADLDKPVGEAGPEVWQELFWLIGTQAKPILERLAELRGRCGMAHMLAARFLERVEARAPGGGTVGDRWSDVELQRLLNEVVGLPLDTSHPHLPLEGLADYILWLQARHNLP